MQSVENVRRSGEFKQLSKCEKRHAMKLLYMHPFRYHFCFHFRVITFFSFFYTNTHFCFSLNQHIKIYGVCGNVLGQAHVCNIVTKMNTFEIWLFIYFCFVLFREFRFAQVFFTAGRCFTHLSLECSRFIFTYEFIFNAHSQFVVAIYRHHIRFVSFFKAALCFKLHFVLFFFSSILSS